uniref:Uncharacterized protein n=1 Tax=Arundo donax TaxID=35708 RepID=A0A0A9GWB3_ARUDO
MEFDTLKQLEQHFASKNPICGGLRSCWAISSSWPQSGQHARCGRTRIFVSLVNDFVKNCRNCCLKLWRSANYDLSV